MLYCSLPRQGKTSALARRIARHQGACVAASSKPDLYWLTVHRRRRQGPVHVFNPGGFGEVTSTVRWNVLAGCEDEDTACRRAADLTGKQYAGRGDMQFWISKATVALAALMHAAALGGRTILDVLPVGRQRRHPGRGRHPAAAPPGRAARRESAGTPGRGQRRQDSRFDPHHDHRGARVLHGAEAA